MENRLAAIAADPGAPVRLRLPVGEDGDRPVHPNPALAMAMLEARRLLAQNPELRAVLHRPIIPNARSSPSLEARACRPPKGLSCHT